MVDDVYVARFDGSAWDTSFGAPTSAPDTGRNGYSFALDSHDRPVVAWTEYFAQLTVHVGAWTGVAWNTQFPAAERRLRPQHRRRLSFARHRQLRLARRRVAGGH